MTRRLPSPRRTARRRLRVMQLAALVCGTVSAGCTSGAHRAGSDTPADSTTVTGRAGGAGEAGTVPATDTLRGVPPTAAAPVLTRVAPDTIHLGRGAAPTLTLSGSGFVPGHTGGSGGFAVGGNAVHVGRATFDMVAADTSGRTIRFAMPLTYTDTAARGRPSTFAPGTFSVSVTTPNGTSNALSLVMIP